MRSCSAHSGVSLWGDAQGLRSSAGGCRAGTGPLVLPRREPRCRSWPCPSTRRDTNTSTSRIVTFRLGTFWMNMRQRSKFKYAGWTRRVGHGRLAFEGREPHPLLRPDGHWFGGVGVGTAFCCLPSTPEGKAADSLDGGLTACRVPHGVLAPRGPRQTLVDLADPGRLALGLRLDQDGRDLHTCPWLRSPPLIF